MGEFGWEKEAGAKEANLESRGTREGTAATAGVRGRRSENWSDSGVCNSDRRLGRRDHESILDVMAIADKAGGCYREDRNLTPFSLQPRFFGRRQGTLDSSQGVKAGEPRLTGVEGLRHTLAL